MENKNTILVVDDMTTALLLLHDLLKDTYLLNKSFEKSDNETIISLLENILKDFDAK